MPKAPWQTKDCLLASDGGMFMATKQALWGQSIADVNLNSKHCQLVADDCFRVMREVAELNPPDPKVNLTCLTL